MLKIRFNTRHVEHQDETMPEDCIASFIHEMLARDGQLTNSRLERSGSEKQSFDWIRSREIYHSELRGLVNVP